MERADPPQSFGPLEIKEMMQQVLAWEFDMAREPWGGKLCKRKVF